MVMESGKQKERNKSEWGPLIRSKTVPPLHVLDIILVPSTKLSILLEIMF